jgi:hypothetical protein
MTKAANYCASLGAGRAFCLHGWRQCSGAGDRGCYTT